MADRVVEATAGRGVPGALVIIFLPGIDPVGWFNDPGTLTTGSSDGTISDIAIAPAAS